MSSPLLIIRSTQMVFTFYFSFFHSLFDKRLVHAAESAHFIERSTESSWQFIVQLVGLTSGAIRHDDYVFQFTTLAGKTVGLPQGR